MKYFLFVLMIYVVVGTLVYWRPKWWRGDFITWSKLFEENPLIVRELIEASPYDLKPTEAMMGMRVATALYWPHVMSSAIRRKIYVWRRARRVARLRLSK